MKKNLDKTYKILAINILHVDVYILYKLYNYITIN